MYIHNVDEDGLVLGSFSKCKAQSRKAQSAKHYLGDEVLSGKYLILEGCNSKPWCRRGQSDRFTHYGWVAQSSAIALSQLCNSPMR